MKENDRKKVHFWRFVFKYLKNYKRLIVISVICSLITGFAVATQPLIIKYIVDGGVLPGLSGEIEKDRAFIYILILCGIYVVISTARVLSWRVGYKNLLKTVESAMFTLRSDLYSSIQRKCMRFYEKNSSGELYNYILGSPMGNIREYINKVIMSIPYQVIAFIISIVALANYNWVLTVTMTLIALVMTICTFLSRKKIRAAWREYLSSEKETSKYMTDIFNGIDAVKVYSIEDSMLHKFRYRLREYRDRGLKFNYLSTAEALKPEFVQYIGTAIIYVLGAVFCLWGENLPGGKITTGELYAFLSSMGSILSILISWFTLTFQRTAAETSLEKILAVMEEQSSTPEVDDRDRHSVSREERIAMNAGKPCIEYRDVSFAYDANRPIFRGLSVKLHYGESIGLVGSSGCGKSTFTKLIMRLYEVTEGEVLVHGVNVKEYPTHDLRASFGIVPQSPFIFYGSILDNIKITRPDATPEEIQDAMDAAHVTEFLPDMPEGLDTIIGNGAMSLSGGQKQRVAIARAILKRPDILIFDEATSALDNKSERLIQQAIEQLMKNHTILIIAHRLSTVRNVDRILLFEDGVVAEDGSYDELAAREGGKFYALLHADEEVLM